MRGSVGDTDRLLVITKAYFPYKQIIHSSLSGKKETPLSITSEVGITTPQNFV